MVDDQGLELGEVNGGLAAPPAGFLGEHVVEFGLGCLALVEQRELLEDDLLGGQSKAVLRGELDLFNYRVDGGARVGELGLEGGDDLGRLGVDAGLSDASLAFSLARASLCAASACT